MKAWQYLCGCALAGLVPFWAAQEFPSDPQDRVGPQKLVIQQIPPLPDPSAIARQIQARLGALSPALWAPLASDKPVQPGPMATVQAAPPLVVTQRAFTEPKRLPEADPFPPAQVVDALSGNISAIIRSNGAMRLVVADRKTTVRQVYQVGDRLGGVWSISRILPDQVILARKGQTVRVPVGYSTSQHRQTFQSARPLPSATATPPMPSSPSTYPRRRVTRHIAASK